LYQDFLRYAAEAKRNRDEAIEAQKKAKIAKRQRNLALLRSMVVTFVCLLGLAAVGGFIYWISTLRPV
jgi:cell division septal protein FtsQ